MSLARRLVWLLGMVTLAVPSTPGIAQNTDSAVAAPATCAEHGSVGTVERAWTAYRAGNDSRASDLFRSVAAACPDHLDAQLGLGFALARSGRSEEARALLQSVRDARPGDAEPLKGLARLEGWQGNLETALALWRTALALHPADLEAQVGLARTLRWSGRTAEAESELRSARSAQEAKAPQLENEWYNLRAQTGPATSLRFTHESDSDGNHVNTTELRATLTVVGNAALRWRTAFRATDLDGERNRRALEHFLESSWRHPSGVTIAGGLGLSETSLSDNPVAADGRVRVSAGAANELEWAIDFGRYAVPYTTQMIERGVRTVQLGADLRSTATRGWQWDVRAEAGEYDGHQSNRRWALRGALLRPTGSWGHIGVRVQSFGFSDDVNDGYYDPRSFGAVELPWQTTWTRGPLQWSAHVAPGLQGSARVRGPQASLRTSGALRWSLAPGRSLEVAGTWARSSAQRLGDGVGTYRYGSVAVAGTWVF